MTIEEQLKNHILANYKSIRAFTTEIGIPYSTLDSALKRGVSGMGIGAAIKVFNSLDLDVESVVTGVLAPKQKMQAFGKQLSSIPSELMKTDEFQEINNEYKARQQEQLAWADEVADYYPELNDLGRAVAIERVEELTHNPKYQKKKPSVEG